MFTILTVLLLTCLELGINAQNCSAVGGTCGGFRVNPPQCCADLNCIYSGVPDVPGKCEECTKSGGACDAFVLNSNTTYINKCCEGFTCERPNDADPGSCVCRNENESCGGFTAGPSPVCCAGFVCYVSPRNPEVSDLPGNCKLPSEACSTTLCGGIQGFKCCDNYYCDDSMRDVNKTGQFFNCVQNQPTCRAEGAMCGGIAAFQCCSGLTCVTPPPIYPDKSGTCQQIGTLPMPTVFPNFFVLILALIFNICSCGKNRG